MPKISRRGPKKGKRLTIEIQADMIIEALYSKKDMNDIVEQYKKDGYNIQEDAEQDLKSFSRADITFLLGNIHILKNIKEEAIKSIITNITKIKKTSI